MAASTIPSVGQASFLGLLQRIRQFLGCSLPSRLWFPLLSTLVGLLLLSLGNAAMALQQGDQGEAVSNLQTELTNAGCYTGPVTGYFGPLTETGVMQCQAHYGLEQDGIAGTQTIAALTGASSPANSTNLLERGSRGDRVVQLQQHLTTLGYSVGEIDGIFGQITEAAVIRFQQDAQLPVTGKVGSQEIAAIDQRIANSAQPKAPTQAIQRSQLAQGDYGSEVGQLQRRLKELGFFEPSVTEYYGDLTQAAVSNFQRSQGIPSSGIADTQTLEALKLRSATLSTTSPTANPAPVAIAEPTPPPAQPAASSSPFNSQPFTAQSASAQPFNSQPFITAPNSTSTQAYRWGQRHYVVVIPTQSGATLSQVKKVWTQAIEKSSPKGSYIEAGAFSTRSEADRQTKFLQAYGLDARVDYQ